MSDNDDRLDILKRHATMMREHFDSVQIIASRKDSNGYTTRFEWGDGSWYERYGLLQVAVLEMEEGQRARARRESADEDDE